MMLITVVVGWDVAHTPVKADEPVELTVASPTALPTPLPIPDDIVGYINYKFGDRASDALLVLQGNGPGSCAENRHLDPKAVNDNRTWGGLGRDRGIFQISDYYHPGVSDVCAFDFKCNIDYAYRMFVNDHNSFSRWTCGKFYGV